MTLVFNPLRVSAVSRDAEAVVVSFDVPPHLGDAYSFAAGQHVSVRATALVDLRRTYSICAPEGDKLRIAIRHVPGGQFSTWANGSLRAGDELEVMTPTGRFVDQPASDLGQPRQLAAIAAGSGITPILSIAATALAREPHTTVTLVYSNRSLASTMFVEELEALKNRFLDRLQLWYVFTREEGSTPLLSGRLDQTRLRELLTRALMPDDADWYFVCGPVGLIHAARAVLPADRLRAELFASSAPRVALPRPAPPSVQEAPFAAATATLQGRSFRFDIREGETVLDAASRVRTDVPFSCRAGVCSTCRALLTDGEVAMDTALGLEPSDIAEGYVLTCQARPVSASLSLDFDR